MYFELNNPEEIIKLSNYLNSGDTKLNAGQKTKN